MGLMETSPVTGELRPLRILISGPGDVGPEQLKAREVIACLASEFSAVARLEVHYWPYELSSMDGRDGQDMPDISDVEILICILWTRLGALAEGAHSLPRGHVVYQGIEHLLTAAKEHYQSKGVPDIMVWHKTAEQGAVLDAEFEGKLRQFTDLQDFLKKWTQDQNERVSRGAVNSYDTLERFEELLEVKLRKLIGRRLGNEAGQARARLHWMENPYLGLNVFEYEHAPIFFGRTRWVDEATTRLRNQLVGVWRAEASQEEPEKPAEKARASVVIFGASGSGKSSLARAGILPMLVRGNVIEGIDFWRCAVMKPSDQLGNLMMALASALVQNPAARSVEFEQEETKIRPMALPEAISYNLNADEIARKLKRTPELAAEIVRGAISQIAALAQSDHEKVLHGKIATYEKEGRNADAAKLRERLARPERLQPRGCLALVLDQMEELFTQTTAIGREEVGLFLRAIDTLAAGGQVVIIATMRSEFYHRCEQHQELMALKRGDGTIHLTPPNDDELGLMIRKPAEAAGVKFEEIQNRRLNDCIVQAARRNPDCLPLVEFCLEELYKQCKDKGVIDFQTYQDRGELGGVLSKYAKEVYSDLLAQESGVVSPEIEKSMNDVLHDVFNALTTIGAEGEGKEGYHKLVRRVVRYDELMRGEEPLKTKRLVDAFIGARLFTTDITDVAEKGERTVRVTHEALLRNWDRIKDWFSDEGNERLIRVRAQVEQRMKAWKELTGKKAGAEDDHSLFLQPGRELDEAKAELEKRSPSFEAIREFIELSLANSAEQDFRACIQAGGEVAMQNGSDRIRSQYPGSHLKVLTKMLEDGRPGERRNAILLLGLIDLGEELSKKLIHLAIADPEESVRRVAAYSIARQNRADLCAQIAETAEVGGEKSAATGALAHILVAADMETVAEEFDTWFRRQPKQLRRRVRLKAWWLRLRNAIPVFFAIVVPATVLGVVAAMMFDWLPGLANYAFGGAFPGGAIAVFHAATAAVLLVGGAAVGLTFYRMVLGREHGKFDYFNPFGSIVAGTLAGALGGLFCTIAIAGVFSDLNLRIMGWIDTGERPELGALSQEIFLHNRCGLIFVLNGIGVGAGMALVTNRLRGSDKWREFLSTQTTSSMGNLKLAMRLVGDLIRLALPAAWPLPVVLFLTSVAGLFALNPEWHLPPNSDVFRGGMIDAAATEEELAKLRAWKTCVYGRASGIAGDATAMMISAFFGVAGIGFGVVILRSGINVDPQRRFG